MLLQEAVSVSVNHGTNHLVETADVAVERGAEIATGLAKTWTKEAASAVSTVSTIFTDGGGGEGGSKTLEVNLQASMDSVVDMGASIATSWLRGWTTKTASNVHRLMRGEEQLGAGRVAIELLE